MVEIYEDTAVPAQPAYTKQQYCGVQCDLCGKRSDRAGDWEAGAYEIRETNITVMVYKRIEVSTATGEAYPSGGYKTTRQVDLCPECFEQKLIPWLQSQGAQLRECESDW